MIGRINQTWSKTIEVIDQTIKVNQTQSKIFIFSNFDLFPLFDQSLLLSLIDSTDHFDQVRLSLINSIVNQIWLCSYGIPWYNLYLIHRLPIVFYQFIPSLEMQSLHLIISCQYNRKYSNSHQILGQSLSHRKTMVQSYILY